jgi:hypothetical protein
MNRIILLLVILGIVGGGRYGVHNLAYQTDEWKQYNEYNKYRTQVYDFYSFPNYEENEEFYNSLDVKEEEMSLIQSANLGFDENITIEKMKSIYMESKRLKEEYQQFYSVPRKIIFDYFDSFEVVGREVIIIYILYGALLMLVIVKKRNSLWIGLASTFFIRSILISYLIYRGRFIRRVSGPMAVAEICVLLGIILHGFIEDGEKHNIEHERGMGITIGRGIIILVMLLLLVDVYKENLDRNRAIKTEESWVANLFPYLEKNIEKTYVLEVQSTATLKAPVFGENSNMPKNALYLGGWLQKSPLIQKQYENRMYR